MICPAPALPRDLPIHLPRPARRHGGSRRNLLCPHRHPGQRLDRQHLDLLLRRRQLLPGAQVDLNHRFSRGLLLRGVYTRSKTIDDGDSVNATTSGGEPALASNPFDLRADRGLANFDVRNVAVINASYALPLGKSLMARGWTVNSIVTLQGGFPFTPQLSYNPSNNGDTPQPGAAVRQPELHRPGDSGHSEPVVQPGRLPGAAERQRILRQPGPRHPDRPRPGHLGLFPAQRHRGSRAPATCNSAPNSSIS